MTSTQDSNVRLSTAERNSIILNESRGIHHPLYYVCTTKTGKIQVRKRKQPLTTVPPPAQTLIHNDQIQTQATNETTERNDSHDTSNDYNSVSNRELLERMLDVLQKNVVSNDPNHNSVENEKITQENQQFIDNIVEQKAPQMVQSPQQLRSQSSQHIDAQPPQPPVPVHTYRRGRVLI